MSFLLDTNALIFYIMGDSTMPSNIRETIRNSECHYSYISLWEIAIKQKLNKLKVPYTIQDIDTFCRAEKFKTLTLTPSHIEQTKQLPLIHRDPFDRLLIAQAQTQNLTIITRDTIIPQYNIKTIW